MTGPRPEAKQEEKRRIGQAMWLSYYNQVLLDRGMLTEAEWARMEGRIRARAQPAPAR